LKWGIKKKKKKISRSRWIEKPYFLIGNRVNTSQRELEGRRGSWTLWLKTLGGRKCTKTEMLGPPGLPLILV